MGAVLEGGPAMGKRDLWLIGGLLLLTAVLFLSSCLVVITLGNAVGGVLLPLCFKLRDKAAANV